jgi:hypothetical protein
MQGKNGVIQMEEQMSLFDMGGLADDGAMRDPVSGNEVPPGSMASEVRDDVPAMLSEGEYIIPADVVRYYGVKFFEELRAQAKEGLMDMEQNGRIGGEPVDAPMGGDELSPEEMQMLAELSGMYGGGMVQKGYQTGGMVAPMTQEQFMQQGQQGSQFQLPRSIFAPSAPAQPATAPITPVTLYGPTGDVIVLMIPTDQEQYNRLIAQGYTTEPRPTQAPADAGSEGSIGIAEPEVTTGGGGFKLSEDKVESLKNDPLGFGKDALQGGGFSTRQMTGAGGLLGGMPGALAGGLVGAALELNSLAEAKAALEVAKAQNLVGTSAYTELENAVKTAEKNLSGGARLLNNLGLGTGKNFIAQALGEPGVTKTPTAARASVTGGADSLLAPKTSPVPTQRPERSEGDSWAGGAVASNQSAPSASRTSEEARSAAQSAADRLGVDMATRGRATGGLVAKRKKTVAKKK